MAGRPKWEYKDGEVWAKATDPGRGNKVYGFAMPMISIVEPGVRTIAVPDLMKNRQHLEKAAEMGLGCDSMKFIGKIGDREGVSSYFRVEVK